MDLFSHFLVANLTVINVSLVFNFHKPVLRSSFVFLGCREATLLMELRFQPVSSTVSNLQVSFSVFFSHIAAGPSRYSQPVQGAVHRSSSANPLQNPSSPKLGDFQAHIRPLLADVSPLSSHITNLLQLSSIVICVLLV